MTLIITYTNELFGCINEFETIYRKLRHGFKSEIFSFVIVEGVDCFNQAYDKGDDACLYDFIIPRVKHEFRCIDDGEAFENSCYDDIMEHIRYSKIGCNCLKNLETLLRQLKTWH